KLAVIQARAKLETGQANRFAGASHAAGHQTRAAEVSGLDQVVAETRFTKLVQAALDSPAPATQASIVEFHAETATKAGFITAAKTVKVTAHSMQLAIDRHIRRFQVGLVFVAVHR